MEEIEYAVGTNILTKEDLCGLIYQKKLTNDSDKSNIYMLELKDKFVIVERTGKCDYKKCKNACCKFCVLAYPHEYFEGFGKIGNNKRSLIMEKKCKFLEKDGTCQKWGKKSKCTDPTIGGMGKYSGFPRACEQFPHPDDSVFYEVMDVCTFKFNIIYTITKTEDLIRTEMLNNFQEQIK